MGDAVSEADSILVMLARMEGKLDMAIAAQKVTDVKVEDHEMKNNVDMKIPRPKPGDTSPPLVGAQFVDREQHDRRKKRQSSYE